MSKQFTEQLVCKTNQLKLSVDTDEASHYYNCNLPPSMLVPTTIASAVGDNYLYNNFLTLSLHIQYPTYEELMVTVQHFHSGSVKHSKDPEPPKDTNWL